MSELAPATSRQADVPNLPPLVPDLSPLVPDLDFLREAISRLDDIAEWHRDQAAELPDGSPNLKRLDRDADFLERLAEYLWATLLEIRDHEARS